MDRIIAARGLGHLQRPCRLRQPSLQWAFSRQLRRCQSTSSPSSTTSSVSPTTTHKKPYYVTTPIFYVNSDPHVGHMYSMVLADVLKRWQTLLGNKALLCTGTDEHGLKVQQAAAHAGVPPKQFCDEYAATFQHLAEKCNISNDFFIRTTDADHMAAARAFWRRLRRKGYIYQSQHSGWYCVSDETFYPENMVEKRIAPATGKVEMVSTETGKTVEWTEERNYHFRMTAVRERLLQFYRENPGFVVPATRMNEVVEWVTNQLEDLSISRPSTRLAWAVSVPEDPSQTIYVWVDALVNYMTKAGYPERWAPEEQREIELAAEAEGTESPEAILIDANVQAKLETHASQETKTAETAEETTEAAPSIALTPEQRQRHEGGGWPADVHVIGKDIVRFHAIYWPALLLAVDLPLPKRILSHAHWTLGRKKMSKSVGNVVNPFYAMDRFGVDAMRYYLVHDGGIEDDGDYGNEHIVERYKKGLQGGLGNLLGRITRTARWNVRESVVRASGGLLGDFTSTTESTTDKDLSAQIATIRNASGLAAKHMEKLDPRSALHSIMNVVYETNRFMQSMAPWDLAKQLAESPTARTATPTAEDEALRLRLDQSIYLASEALRVVGILLQPVIPRKAEQVLDTLGVGHAHRTFGYAQLGADDAYGLPLRPAGKGKGDVLFPPLPVED